MPMMVVSQSMEPIRISKLGPVLTVAIFSSLFRLGYAFVACGYLSLRFQAATYFSTRTTQETRGCNYRRPVDLRRLREPKNDLIIALGKNKFRIQTLSGKRRSSYIKEKKVTIPVQWAGRLAWLGHLLDVQKVAGPNPVRPTTKSSTSILKIFYFLVRFGCLPLLFKAKCIRAFC